MEFSRNELPKQQHDALREYVFSIIGCMHEVYGDLGDGFPEYIYQEALFLELTRKGYDVKREYVHHPVYKGHELKSAIKMDLVVMLQRGNVIIECKAISAIGYQERKQTFGYLRGTGFPIAILVNFGAQHRAEIERYFCKNNIITPF